MIRAQIYGRAVRDSELRESKSRKAYASVDVACREGHDRETTWVKVVVYSERGINQLSTVLKGAAVGAIGRLEVGVWTSQGGEPRPDITLFADSLITAAPPRDGARKAARARGNRRSDEAEPLKDKAHSELTPKTPEQHCSADTPGDTDDR